MEPEYSTSSVYRSVIDDVVNHVKPEFVGEGIDEAVLDELRVLWETKLTQSGVLDTGPAVAQSAGTYAQGYAQRSGYPQAGTYGQPYGQAGFSLGQPQAHLHSHSLRGAPAAAGMLAGSYVANGALGLPATQYGAGAYGRAAGLAQVPAGGGSYAAPQSNQPAVKRKLEEVEGWPMGAVPAKHAAHAGGIPQQDGPADDADDTDAAGGAVAAGGSSTTIEKPAEERDTLSDVESDDAEDDKEYANVVVAQFEKVTRTKNKWKCTLKDGVMHLNGRDYLFNRASGEMQF